MLRMLLSRQRFLYLVIFTLVIIIFVLVHMNVTPLVPSLAAILRHSDTDSVTLSPLAANLSLPTGLKWLKSEDVQITSKMSASVAEERFYRFVTQKHIHCSHTVRIGNYADGGWDMCVVAPYTPKKPCIVYSFGINNDWSFDDSISKTYGCSVRAFDPSMRAGDHKHSSLVYFYHTGIGKSDTTNGQGWKIRTLSTLLKDIGDSNKIIEYLKIDIEYNEWDSFAQMFSTGVMQRVKQFAFEIHTHELASGSATTIPQFVMYYQTLKKLEDLGFRRYHYHMNPLGMYHSARTGKSLSCCYELYYINMNFISHPNFLTNPPIPPTTTTVATTPVTTATTKLTTPQVLSSTVKFPLPSHLPTGLTMLNPPEIKFALNMTPRTMEDNFYRYLRQTQISCNQQTRMGNAGDGGWDMCIIPPYKLKSPCIVYSFGINNDWSFDDSVSKRYGCTVRAFDPSMRMNDHKHSSLVWFYHTGIGGSNKVNSQGWKIKTLSTLFKDIGDSEHVIDYLKIDIEYNEWDSFKAMFQENSLKNVKQFGFEIHTHELYGGSPTTNAQFMNYVDTLRTLESKGFRRFLSHLNPYGRYSSRRTGLQQSCCYELYYLNLNFIDSKFAAQHAPSLVTTPAPAKQVENAGKSEPLINDVESGIVSLKYPDIHITPNMQAIEAEELFYRYMVQVQIKCPQIVRMGNWADGGWNMCVSGPFKPKEPCTIYSFGINNDWSFDDAVAQSYKCKVKAFDPSMSIGDHQHSKLVWFYHTGIGGHNLVNGQGWKIKTLQTLLTELGDAEHDIDYLKIDIEYNEWDTFEGMFRENALKRVKQFGFEIHTHELAGGSPTTADQFYMYWRTIKRLESFGFRRYLYHFNPLGQYNSARTGKRRTCCYELYYINTNYIGR